jgi:hypothetical protein
VAVFTFTLWQSTLKLWETGEKQIAVADKYAGSPEPACSGPREVTVLPRSHHTKPHAPSRGYVANYASKFAIWNLIVILHVVGVAVVVSMAYYT